MDWDALERARRAPAHATLPAKMVGGDMPKWDADMEFWCNDIPSGSLEGPTYACSDDATNGRVVSGEIN